MKIFAGNVTTINRIFDRQNTVSAIALARLLFNYKTRACQFSVSNPKSGKNNLLFPTKRGTGLLPNIFYITL